LSINHLSTHRIAFSEDDVPASGSSTSLTGLLLRRHFFLSLGYVFDLKPNFVLRPSILIKRTNGALPNVDLTLSALIYKRLWLGISLRNNSSLVFMIDVNITDFLRIGYAYDQSLGALAGYNRGSHEAFLGFDFNLKKSNVVSPRYL
jgi:type IX secretion system PorP/SprF family membrane protein